MRGDAEYPTVVISTYVLAIWIGSYIPTLTKKEKYNDRKGMYIHLYQTLFHCFYTIPTSSVVWQQFLHLCDLSPKRL